MQRHLYLACYDISDPRRLHKVHKIVQAYAIGGQKSFYECWLTEDDRTELLSRVESAFDPDEDQFRLFRLDSEPETIFMGVASRQNMKPLMVV